MLAGAMTVLAGPVITEGGGLKVLTDTAASNKNKHNNRVNP